MFKQLVLAAGVCLLLSIGVSALPAEEPSQSFEGSLQYLDAQPPGPRSAIAYSLAGKPIRPEVALTLEEYFRSWYTDEFPSAVMYETALLSLIKLQEAPEAYHNMDLFSKLYQQSVLIHDGLDGVTGALVAYSASGLDISQSQPNSPNSLIDRVIAAQQRSGGFAKAPGENADVAVTARALVSLFPYQSGSDVKSAVSRALDWLAGQQNGDGTFSVKGLPSGSATAEVLLAASLYSPNSAQFNQDAKLESALEQFLNLDGGYAEVLGGASSVETTELAVIARYAAATGKFPYYAPERYPEYIENQPPPVPQNPWASYGKFLIAFALVFFLVYLLLMITVRIGRFAEQKKLPGSLAAQAAKSRQEAEELSYSQEENTQMHISMQAEIPNFDEISEQESEIGHNGDTGQDK